MGQSSPWGSAVSEPGVAVAGAWSQEGTCRAPRLPLSEKPGPAGSTCEWVEMLLVGRDTGRETSINWHMIFQLSTLMLVKAVCCAGEFSTLEMDACISHCIYPLASSKLFSLYSVFHEFALSNFH